MTSSLWRRFRRLLAGVRLNRAIERNEHAASELDRVLKEVFRE